MNPKLALFVYGGFILFLFRCATRQGWSRALWIPLIWILIVCSRPVGLWLALLTSTGRDSDGSYLDVAILLSLMGAGIRILRRRGVGFAPVFAQNRWLFLYFAYAGISVLWSDQPFSATKLWVKDAGHIIMALVILSERPIGVGARSTLTRAAYVLIPLSIMLIKYFPDLGRAYDTWTWQPMSLGVTDSKNLLGATTIVCSLGLFLSIFDKEDRERGHKFRLFLNAFLVLMMVWLLLTSHCSTALGCTVIAFVLFLLLRNSRIRAWTQNMGFSLLLLLCLSAILLFFAFGFVESLVVGPLGRDMSFNGRIPIWQACLNIGINPFFGTGFAAFWRGGGRAEQVSQSLNFFFTLKEAHNGYLETYLNGGLIGVTLLFSAIVGSLSRITRQLRTDRSYSVFRLVCALVALIYNFTESAFAGFNAIWFLLLLAILRLPVAARASKPPAIRRATAARPALVEAAA